MIRTFDRPDIVTMQRKAPHSVICRVMVNVEAQSCEHRFLAGNRECMLDHPLVKGADSFLGSHRARAGLKPPYLSANSLETTPEVGPSMSSTNSIHRENAIKSENPQRSRLHSASDTPRTESRTCCAMLSGFDSRATAATSHCHCA